MKTAKKTILLGVLAFGTLLSVNAEDKIWKNNRPDAKGKYGFSNAFIEFFNATKYPINIQLYRPKDIEEGEQKLANYQLGKAEFTPKGVKESSIVYVLRNEHFGGRNPCVTHIELNVQKPTGTEKLEYAWNPAENKESFFCKHRGTEYKTLFGTKPLISPGKDYAGYFVVVFEKDGALHWHYAQDIPHKTEDQLKYIREREALSQKRKTFEQDINRKIGEYEAKIKAEPKKAEKFRKEINKLQDKLVKERYEYTRKIADLDQKNRRFWS